MKPVLSPSSPPVGLRPAAAWSLAVIRKPMKHIENLYNGLCGRSGPSSNGLNRHQVGQNRVNRAGLSTKMQCQTRRWTQRRRGESSADETRTSDHTRGSSIVALAWRPIATPLSREQTPPIITPELCSRSSLRTRGPTLAYDAEHHHRSTERPCPRVLVAAHPGAPPPAVAWLAPTN